MKNIVPIQEIKQLGENLREEGQKIVLVGGCFDILHFGHFRFLEEAKKQGDILVVLLESDNRIQKLKGNKRPVHTISQRAHMLTSLRFVDYVVLLPDTITDQEYEKVTKEIQPAIIATTKRSDSLPYIEKQAKQVGASLYIGKQVENLSTSRIVDLLGKEI